MKLFGVDTSLKWIDFEHGEKHYSIHFKDSFFRGVYDVTVWEGDGKGFNTQTETIIRSTYPVLMLRIKEFWIRLLIWMSFKMHRR